MHMYMYIGGSDVTVMASTWSNVSYGGDKLLMLSTSVSLFLATKYELTDTP